MIMQEEGGGFDDVLDAGGVGGGTAERALLQRDILGGKGFEHLSKFAGGESEWNEWSGDFKTTAETRCEMVAEALNFVKTEGKAEKEVAPRAAGAGDLTRGLCEVAAACGAKLWSSSFSFVELRVYLFLSEKKNACGRTG